jgi:hypothetical protein
VDEEILAGRESGIELRLADRSASQLRREVARLRRAGLDREAQYQHCNSRIFLHFLILPRREITTRPGPMQL